MGKLATRMERGKRKTPKYSIRTNIWRYTPKGATDDTDHPAPFPEALAHDHIISWSNPGATVLDCFAGSLTTAKMSLMTGRKAIAIDICAEYLEKDMRRLNLARLPLFEQPDVEVTAEQLGLTI
jgi:site-specific DNA-methyltransferase (adenine-specific)